MQFPQWLEDALWAAARARLGAEVCGGAVLRQAVEERSRRYTSERAELDRPAGRADLAARALFFTVADAPKVQLPLAELAGRGALPASAPLRVVDVGAGAGAMTLGIAAGLDRPLDVVALDRDRAALDIFADVAAAVLPGVTLATRTADVAAIDRLGADGVDLAVAGSVFNELDDAAAWRLLGLMVDAIHDGGAVIVIEPALRETSRRLHALRDRAIAAGLGHVFAPCTRAAAPCPALTDPGDWCHEHRLVELPSRTRDLARVTGLRDSGARFSYLVLRRGALPLVDAVPGRRALRVVSHPLKPKGKLECFGCGDDGRIRVRRLSRERSDVNRPFERARRGDVLLLSGDGGEIRRDTAVDVIATDGSRPAPSPT